MASTWESTAWERASGHPTKKSAFELAEDLRKARAGLPLTLAGAARYPETARESASTEGGAHPGSSEGAPRRGRPVAIGLVALAALMALLGAFGWDLTGVREGPKAVGTVTATEGAREGGAPVAPEGSRERDSGKGVGSGTPSVDLAGGAYVPASSSASSSAPASASPASDPASASPASASASASASPELETSKTVASGTRASNPRESGAWGAAPSASSPAPGDSSGSGGQDAGTTSTGVVESAAQEQYR